MLRPTETELRRIAQIIIGKGQESINTAAHNGEYGDGGGGALVKEANAFLAGLDRRMPAGWEQYLPSVRQQLQRETDPEYAEYVRLQSKFGHR